MDILKRTIIREFTPIVTEELVPLQEKACNYLDSIKLKENEKEVIIQAKNVNGELYGFLVATDFSNQVVRQIDVNGQMSFKLTELVVNMLKEF